MRQLFGVAKVIGMNTNALRRRSSLAIPYSTIKRLAAVLREKGHIPKPYLGVGLQPVRVPESLRQRLNLTQDLGALVVHVESASPADKAELLPGDILLGVDEQKFGHHGLTSLVFRLEPNRDAKIAGIRGGQHFSTTIHVGERPRRQAGMQRALRVFIVAENDTECRELSRTFEEAAGFIVVGVTATSSSAALQAASFDVAIIQAPQGVRSATLPETRVPTLYLLSDVRSQPKELTGKNAVLSRNASAPQIRAAAMAVAVGLRVAQTNNSAAVENDAELAFVEPLTDRELRVLNLLAEGLSNPKIARVLSISRNTVKFHVSSIISKLGATSRTEAVTIGVKRGLIIL